MKKLEIYQENGNYVIRRINQFNHATKREFISTDGLLEAVALYKDNIDEYDLVIQQDIGLLDKIMKQLA